MQDPFTQFTWKASAQLVQVDLSHASQDAKSGQQAVLSLRQLIDDGHSFHVSATRIRAIEGQGPVGVLQCETSGSTGAPKVIERTQQSWIDSFEVNRQAFELSPDDCYAVFGRIEHSLALYGVLEAVHIGANILSLAGLRPDRQAMLLTDAGVSVLYATPTQLGQLPSDRPILSPRLVLVGGGKLTPEALSRAKVTLPNAEIRQFYGASETSFIALADTHSPDHSVGRAYPGVSISIRTPDGQPTTEIGEIWVKSPFLFQGYAVGASDDTRWSEGYVSVGEMGRMDNKGNLFVIGRRNRMVTVSDQNVFPEEVETFLESLDDIAAAVVVALADAKRGHRLVAVVQGQTDTALLIDDILRQCRQVLGATKTPSRLFQIDTLPLLAAGKPDLVALKQWIGERL